MAAAMKAKLAKMVTSIESKEQWDELVAGLNGRLLVMDVHKQWCGRSSETGVGFDIRDAGPSKGQGVFALRDFEVGDKIMVEGPSLKAEHNSPVALADLRALSESTCAHLMAMSPLSIAASARRY